MPFTPSHVAAVLPLVRFGLVPSALVVGSMVPDLPYFLPTPLSGASTHTVEGALSLDLLLGLLVLSTWHILLAPAAVALAPTGLRRRLPVAAPSGTRRLLRQPRSIVLVLVSLAWGALTHVAWDSFTHPGRWGQQHVRWLATPHGPLMGYGWAQHVSTLVGAVILCSWCVRWFRTTPLAGEDPPGLRAAASRTTKVLSAVAVCTALLVGGLLGGLRPLLTGGRDSYREAAFFGITRAGLLAGLTCAVVAVCVLAVGRLQLRRG